MKTLNIFAVSFRKYAFRSLALALGLSLSLHAQDTGKTFSTPEDAVAELVAAAGRQDTNALRSIFGPAAEDIVNPDHVQFAYELGDFNDAVNQRKQIVRESDSRCVLEVGDHAWPFPIPIVKKDGKWYFDTAEGTDEILSRRIGKNEISTLESARAYVEAQREYAEKDRDGDKVLEYAKRFNSSPGTKDGLYWPIEMDGEISPMGPIVAQAQAEGYSAASRQEGDAPEPFHGYYFKILTRQGAAVPGGKYDYIINDNMIGGFALVVWPAEHGESGIMTFIVNQQGTVYQKDLGPKTAEIVESMKEYNPDNTWTISRE